MKIRIAAADESLIFHLAQQSAAISQRIVDIDDHRFRFCQAKGFLDGGRKFLIGEQDLGVPMIQNEGDHFGIKAHIESVEHGAGHGHAEMGFVQFGRIGAHGGHRIARTYTK